MEPALPVRYDPALVVISIVIALLGSFTGFVVAARTRTPDNRLRPGWIAAAAFALGTGVWGLHFSSMLALQLPVTVAYNVPLMFVCQLISDGGAAAGLLLVQGPQPRLRHLVGAGLANGIGISGLHYVAMDAMRMPAHVRYEVPLVMLSVLLAVGFSIPAFSASRRFPSHFLHRRWVPMLLATLAMTLAIVGLHYSGMAAARFIPGDGRSGGWNVASGGLPFFVVASTIAILGVALAAATVDRRRHARLDVDRRLLESREQERRRIARVLHEDVGQLLTAVRLDLQRLDGSDEETRSRVLAAMRTLVDQSLESIRDLSVSLRPAALDDLGLVPAIRWLLANQAERAGYDASLDDRLGDIEINDTVATAAFDIVREALTNIARHARATKVTVELRRDHGRVTLAVHDDGAGFDVTAAQRHAAEGRSLGVLDMRETVTRAGGSFVISSERGQGTTVLASFPVLAGS
jgi:signal transduction histidine kinase